MNYFLKDNFLYIAQNIATIHTVLCETQFGRELDEKQKLFVTGFIDILPYLTVEKLSEQDIKNSIFYGDTGVVSLGLYTQRHVNPFVENEPNRDILNFTLQLEAFIFQVDCPYVHYRDIVDSVVDRKIKISKVLNKTLKQGKRSPLYSAIKPAVMAMLSDPDLSQMIKDAIPTSFDDD